MTAYSDEIYYWTKNHEWYGIKDDGTYYLKENAPEKAVESFKNFQEYYKNRKRKRFK